VAKVEAEVRDHLAGRGAGAQVIVSQGRNTEARVEVPRAGL
jgi:hypothetical protein